MHDTDRGTSRLKIAVIGGGACGMTAAVFAARNGADVTLLEGNDRLGKKLAQTGNGRCNFSNTYQSSQCYFGENPTFGWDTAQTFTVQDVLRFFLELGLYSKNRNGYLYPASDQAESVVAVLKMELDRLGVSVFLRSVCKDIRKEGAGFRVYWSAAETDTTLPHGSVINRTKSDVYDRVIVCTGGMSAPKTGSRGDGYKWAKKLGHRIVTPAPALTNLLCANAYFQNLAGVRADALLSVHIPGIPAISARGEVQFCKDGLSGIPAFQLSRHISNYLLTNKEVRVTADMMPDFSYDACMQFLTARARARSQKTASEFLIGLFHKKIASQLIWASHISARLQMKDITEEQLMCLVKNIKSMEAAVYDTGDFIRAQVCSGGVDTREICSRTMESTIVGGLFFGGEILDVDGICGGYNLHFAWASGAIAGKGAAYDPIKSS